VPGSEYNRRGLSVVILFRRTMVEIISKESSCLYLQVLSDVVENDE
jgi:hypothetical protein